MPEVRLISDLDLWDNFVDSSPQGTIFCKSDWLSMYNRIFKIYGYFKGNNLIGGICGFEVLNGTTFDSGCRVPLTPFQGVLCNPLPDKEAKHSALEVLWHNVTDALLPELKYEHIGISNHYSFSDLRPFTWQNYHHIVRYTYLVDLTDMDALYQRLDKQTRYDINHSTEKVTAQSIDDFDKLYTLTFQRKGLERPLTSEFIMNLAQKFPYILIGTESAMAYFIWDNKRAYYILGASDGSGSAKVLWHGLNEMQKIGKREVDFVGCNSREIGRFKRGFGGCLQSYFCAVKT